MMRYWWRLAPSAAYLGGIFYGGLIRLPALPETAVVPADKLLHALVFGVFSWLLVRSAAALSASAGFGKRLLFGAFWASFFGALLEICQAFVPYRSAEVLDWLADTVGAAVAVGLLALSVQLSAWRATRVGARRARSVRG